MLLKMINNLKCLINVTFLLQFQVGKIFQLKLIQIMLFLFFICLIPHNGSKGCRGKESFFWIKVNNIFFNLNLKKLFIYKFRKWFHFLQRGSPFNLPPQHGIHFLAASTSTVLFNILVWGSAFCEKVVQSFLAFLVKMPVDLVSSNGSMHTSFKSFWPLFWKLSTWKLRHPKLESTFE